MTVSVSRLAIRCNYYKVSRGALGASNSRRICTSPAMHRRTDARYRPARARARASDLRPRYCPTVGRSVDRVRDKRSSLIRVSTARRASFMLQRFIDVTRARARVSIYNFNRNARFRGSFPFFLFFMTECKSSIDINPRLSSEEAGDSVGFLLETY